MFLYHGLVPKILWPSETEYRMIRAHGIEESVELVALIAGIGEILLAAAIIAFTAMRWPVLVALGVLVVLLIDVAIFVPDLLTDAFNPVSTNVAGIALALLALREQDSE